MKLENQFFHFFFYPFLIGIIFSSLIIIICSLIFTRDYVDKITGYNIIMLGKEYSKINIDSINTIVSTTFLKIQLGLNELVLLYQNLVKKEKTDEYYLDRTINENFLKCALDIDENHYKSNENFSNIAYWLLDLETNLSKIKKDSFEENQLLIFSNMMKNIYSVFYSSNHTFSNFYFYFESTELYISFPLKYDLENGFIHECKNFSDNPVWCTDKKGEVYKYYKTKCREFYNNIKKAKSDIFDINYKDNTNRTIFVTEFYTQLSTEFEIVFSICIEFIEPFTEKLAYLCSDINANDINYNLDNINSKINGYFFINSVGFSKSFYFPKKSEEALTTAENIYEKNIKYFLQEKTYFSNNIQKLMSSNYIKYINDSLYTELFINGEKRVEQIFYINGEKYEFSIYPIVLENFNGIKEHVLNIIYVYKNQSFYHIFK